MEEDQNRIEESVIDESIIHENGTAENEDEEFGKKAAWIMLAFLVFLLAVFLLNPWTRDIWFSKKEKPKRDKWVASPEEVKLNTQEEIKKDIETRHGNVELISSQETGTGKDRRVECVFRDTEHDFTFLGWSEPKPYLAFRSLKCGYKGSRIRDNYDESYAAWASQNNGSDVTEPPGKDTGNPGENAGGSFYPTDGDPGGGNASDLKATE